MRRFLVAMALLAAIPAAAQLPDSVPTGKQITGLPALGFNSDEGFGYGALLQLYDYGMEGVQPYRYSFQPTVFFTTKGRRDVVLFLDAPHWIAGGWRLNAALAREQQQATPYYGVGNNTVNDIRLSDANKYYYRFGHTITRLNADAQQSAGVPGLRFLLGAGARNSEVNT